jgi:ferritin
MKINDKTLALVQKQIMNEMFNANTYLHMANWCGYNGYKVMEKMFRKQYEGELDHKDRFISLLLESGYMPEIMAIEAPKVSIGVLEDCVRNALKLEQKTSMEICAISDAAEEGKKDHNVYQAIQWFINEQREEEDMFIDMMDFCTNIGLLDKNTPEWLKGSLRNELEKRTAESLED